MLEVDNDGGYWTAQWLWQLRGVLYEYEVGRNVTHIIYCKIQHLILGAVRGRQCGNVRPQLAPWYCTLLGIILASLQPQTLSALPSPSRITEPAPATIIAPEALAVPEYRPWLITHHESD